MTIASKTLAFYSACSWFLMMHKRSVSLSHSLSFFLSFFFLFSFSIFPFGVNFPVLTLAFLFELRKHESRKNASKHSFEQAYLIDLYLILIILSPVVKCKAPLISNVVSILSLFAGAKNPPDPHSL